MIHSLFYSYYFFILKMKNIQIEKEYRILGLMYLKNRGRCIIGKNFKCNSGLRYNPIGSDSKCKLIVRHDAILTIGDNVGISNSTIYCADKIVVGNNVLIGASCQIWDTDFHALDPYVRIVEKDRLISHEPIVIYDNVFIGAQSIVLKGVSIGRNSIIGAGSVVSRSVPENEIWAGNPIKFIRRVDSKNGF